MAVTVENLEARYQCQFDVDGARTAVEGLIAEASAEVNAYLDRVVALQAGYIEVINVLRPDFRIFAKERIDGNLTVEEKPPGGAYVTLVEDDDYVVVDQETGRLHRIYSERAQRSWYVGYNTVRLTYDAGWSTSPVEIDTVIAEMSFARYLFSQKQGEGELIAGAIVNERMGDYNIRYGDVRASAGEQSLAGGGIGISKAHQRMLAPYRRRYVA